MAFQPKPETERNRSDTLAFVVPADCTGKCMHNFLSRSKVFRWQLIGALYSCREPPICLVCLGP